MLSPSSNRATFMPEIEAAADAAPLYPLLTAIEPSPHRESADLPPFSIDTDNDSTPALESEADAWVAAMCKDPKKWLPKLTAASPSADLPAIRAQFSEMYAIYASYSMRDFVERHFRRPETPAGTKPFPLRIEITSLLLCIGLALLGALLLGLSR
jgi:hypothetical protein